ncbi:DUF7520 family protein [Halorussus halophilus]|uniref:DUF7520 family protein n=1 Tax=Halorussus halophilus TaxID=2650975 RepID=UPI001300F7C7|nr:hypothetical protein [Halorussus halophilus]
MTDEIRSSRPIFAVVAVVVIALSGLMGAVVGTTGQERGRAMELLGVELFQFSPVSMALFGMVLTTCVLALLFGLVSFASKRDGEAVSGR